MPPPQPRKRVCLSLHSDCSEHSPGSRPVPPTRQKEQPAAGLSPPWGARHGEPAMGKLHGLFLLIQGKEEHDETPSDQMIAEGWGGRGAFPAHLLALPWPLLAPGPPCPGTEEGWGPARQDHPAPSPLLLRPPHPQAGSGHEILSKTFPLQNNPSKYVFGNRLLIRTGRS